MSGVPPHASLLMATEKLEWGPNTCVIVNARWALPWMWRRRNTDLEFVMLITSAWMLDCCGEREELMNDHPVFVVMAEHSAVLEVFNVRHSSSILKGWRKC